MNSQTEHMRLQTKDERGMGKPTEPGGNVAPKNAPPPHNMGAGRGEKGGHSKSWLKTPQDHGKW